MNAREAATRDATVFRERMEGRELKEIGDRHGLSPEGVRIVVAREGRKQIDRLHLDLLASHATGELPCLLIPDHGGDDFDLAMNYAQWLVARLERVGMNVRVHYRPVFNGVVLALEDADPPENSKARAPKEQ